MPRSYMGGVTLSNVASGGKVAGVTLSKNLRITSFSTAGYVMNDADGDISGGNSLSASALPAHNHTAANEGGDYAWADITTLPIPITQGGTGCGTALDLATLINDLVIPVVPPYPSQPAKYFLAAPNGAAGTPDFRAIVASDIPALSYVAAETDPVFGAHEAHLFAVGDAAKLAGIAAGAEVNVNADWNAVAGDAQILNKPTLGTMAAQAASAVAITGGSVDGATVGATTAGTGRFTQSRVADNSTSAERLTNGDNEAAIVSSAGGTPAPGRCTASQSATVAHAGTNSLLLTPDGTAGTSYFYALSGNAPSLFTFGARYVFTAWVYIPSASSVSAVKVAINFNSVSYFSAAATVKDTWTQITLDTAAPLSQTSSAWRPWLHVVADSSNAANVVYFDDLSLLEYSGGDVYCGGNAIVHGKITGGGNNFGLDIDRSGNGIFDGDLTLTGGDLNLGVSGTTRGTIDLFHGADGNTPGYAKLYSPNGTAWYLFVEDDGTVKIHNAAPAANGDGSVVGAQT